MVDDNGHIVCGSCPVDLTGNGVECHPGTIISHIECINIHNEFANIKMKCIYNQIIMQPFGRYYIIGSCDRLFMAI